jgi:hypothetical protein
MRWAHAVVLGFLATVAGAVPARADSDGDKALAAKLFKQGRDAISAGKLDEACTRFEQSFKLDPAIGTKLNLADCLERKGLLAAAYRLFDEAANEAAKGRKEGRESFARERAEALAKQLVRVEVSIADPSVKGLKVTIADVVVAKEAWGVPRYLAPGVIEVEVSAFGYEPFHTTIEGRAGEVRKIEVPALPRAEIETHGPGKPETDKGLPTVTQPGAGVDTGVVSTEHRRPSRTGAYVVGAVGVALIGTSVGLGFAARSKFRGADCGSKAGLPDGVCSPMGQTTTDDARMLADVGTGVAIAGAVAVGVGVYLWIRAGRRRDHVVVAPTVSDDGVGVVVTVFR